MSRARKAKPNSERTQRPEPVGGEPIDGAVGIEAPPPPTGAEPAAGRDRASSTDPTKAVTESTKVGADTPKTPVGSSRAPTGSGKAAAAVKEPKRRRRATAGFEAKIGYRFKDAALLEQALTHISAIAGAQPRRLLPAAEFLGDHVLGLVVSDMLFRAFPKATRARCRAGSPISFARRPAPTWRGTSSSVPRSGSAPRRPTPAGAAGSRSWPTSARP
jgi:hypothetical protein